MQRNEMVIAGSFSYLDTLTAWQPTESLSIPLDT